MNVGLLWYDNDPRRTLEDKIGRAAERYRQKYGRWPNTCYIHPQGSDEPAGNKELVACGSHHGEGMIRVVSAPTVLLHHLWLGESLADVPTKEAAN